MSTLIGFSITNGSVNQSQADKVQQRALSYFPHIKQLKLKIGESKLTVWGYDKLEECVHRLPDDSFLTLMGQQTRANSWKTLQDKLTRDPLFINFGLPWDGRVILLWISSNGRHWTLRNDWIGSIPVYYARTGKDWIASTLETVVVAGADFTPNDIFIPGLISILLHGHTISNWSFYKDMKVVPPDSISEWKDREFTSKLCYTVQPSTERWESSWDDLIDEMHELIRQAISETLKLAPSWILPLSSGLDSRIIAAVGSEIGIEMNTYTWGTKYSPDVEFAPQIAHALHIPWKWIDTGTDYLAKYVQLWADLFGSAMTFHGMYQMPFLDALKSQSSAPIISGFFGDELAGYDVRFQTDFHSPTVRTYQTVEDGYLHWKVEEISALLKLNTQDALEEIATEIDRQRKVMSGPWYQRIRFLTIWGRQRHFTYFQTKLSDYWRGVGTPYLNRAYARFCLSLPRAALDDRLLLGDMVRRYYGKVAVIPGSFAPEPLILTGSYLLKKRIAKNIPNQLRRGPFRDFSAVPLSRDAECVRATGDNAIWPIREKWKQLGEWVDLERIEREYQSALNGNIRSVRKLQSVQTLAYRLMDS